MTLTTKIVIVLFLLYVIQVSAQTIPTSSYSALSNYSKNAYFQAINKKMIQTYPSYLTQSRVNEVYMYQSPTLISFIIVYTTRSSAIFRTTVNYSPSNKQMNILSFGPVAQRITTTTITNQNRTTMNNNDPGIGITKTTIPVDRQTSSLVQSSNPTIVNRNQTLSNSNRSNSTRTTNNTTNNSRTLTNTLKSGQSSLGGILIRRSNYDDDDSY